MERLGPPPNTFSRSLLIDAHHKTLIRSVCTRCGTIILGSVVEGLPRHELDHFERCQKATVPVAPPRSDSDIACRQSARRPDPRQAGAARSAFRSWGGFAIGTVPCFLIYFTPCSFRNVSSHCGRGPDAGGSAKAFSRLGGRPYCHEHLELDGLVHRQSCSAGFIREGGPHRFGRPIYMTQSQ